MREILNDEYDNNDNTENSYSFVTDSFIKCSSDGYFYVEYKEKLICCLTVIGQIEGHYLLSSENKTTKYENLIPRLINAECDDNVDGLLIIINTVGGDIEAGMAIAELIAGMNKPTVSFVLGGGHSIGIPIAVAAKKSFITKSATMTVHPVRMNGLVMGVPQQLSYFQDMQNRITKFVSTNSSVPEKRFSELMTATGRLVTDFGTVLDGCQAVNEGIIDSIGSVCDALNSLVGLISS